MTRVGSQRHRKETSFGDITKASSLFSTQDVISCVGDTEASCCIPKVMVVWERRMRSTLTERKALSALEHLRIESQFHNNSQLCVNIFLIY
jgi:hypothetical protein